MNKIILLSLLSVTLLLSACVNQKKESSSTGETVTLTHSLGTVNVVKNPQRVVVLDYSALENLDYLGITPVAIPKSNIPSHLRKYGDDKSIADVGSITEVNLEKINEANPDLIIIGTRLVDYYDQLSAIAPVLYPQISGTENFMHSFESNLNDLALLYDKQDEVNTVLEDIKKRVEEVEELTSSSDEKALVLLHNRGRFSAYGSGSRFGIVHDVLGVAQAVEGLDVHRHGNPVSSEFVQKANPDIIFIVDRSMVVEKVVLDKEEIENKLVKQTNAANNGKIYYLNPEMWYLVGGGITSLYVMIDEVAQAFK
ncbi:MAG TPA: ABC transporter substrate-binding protein [Fermentimonas sp.]|nr:ABC transporter substrate-binding protein [Fermentimonas sp.]